MIAITRLLARRLRTVFRRTALGLPPLSAVAPLIFYTAGDRLCVRYDHGSLAVECELSAAYSVAALALPLDALLDVEGNDHATVVLEASASGRTVATWSVGGIPQVREYAVPPLHELAPLSRLPDACLPIKAESLARLAEAAALAGDAASRGNRARIWLRGCTGEILASGNGQFLAQPGFELPWKSDVPVHLSPLWYGPGRPRGRPAALGWTDVSVVFRIGPWTILETIQDEATPPEFAPGTFEDRKMAGHIGLDRADVRLLSRALYRLDRDARSVVLELSAHLGIIVSLPGLSEGDPSRLLLRRSRYAGLPTRITSDVQALARAMRLGITTLNVASAGGPVFGCTARCRFAWWPLIRDDAAGFSKH